LGSEAEAVLAATGNVLSREQRLPATGPMPSAVSDHRVVRWPEAAAGSGGYTKHRAATLAKRSQGRVRAFWGAWKGYEGTMGPRNLATQDMGDVFTPNRDASRAHWTRPVLDNMPPQVYKTLVRRPTRAADAAPLPAAAQASARDRR